MVRALPSAVGAFEAQVFDTSKIYKTVMEQESARRKEQATQKAELDKMMANTFSVKGKSRLQDNPELEKEFQQVQDYYISNNAAIQKPGSPERMEFMKKRSAWMFNAQEAGLRKERDAQLSPYFKAKVDKEELSDKSKELMTIFNLPYNDKRRQDFTYIGADGQPHGIDELNVTDIEKYQKFYERDLMKDIAAVAKPKDIKDLQIRPSTEFNLPKGYSIELTGTTRLVDPETVIQAVTGTLKSTPDARKQYGEMLQSEILTNPNFQQDAANELRLFNDMYKSAGYGRVVNAELDNQPGVTNEVEYAIYRNLKSTLPQDLGNKISTALMNAELGKQRLDLARAGLDLNKRKWANTLSQQQQNLTIDAGANAFFDSVPTEKQVIDFANSESKLLGTTGGGTGGALPSMVKYFKKGQKIDAPGLSGIGNPSNVGNRGVVVYTSQNRLIKPDGTDFDDIEDARKEYGSAYEYKQNEKGQVFALKSVVVPVDGVSTAERGRLLKIAYLNASEAQKGQEAYEMLYKGLYGSGSGKITEPGTTIQVGRGRGSSTTNKTTFTETNINR